YVDQETPYFTEYAKQYTDLPFLVLLDKKKGGYRSDRFLRASDLSDEHQLGDWKTVVWDENSNRPVIPNGSQGFRWDEGSRRNLDLTLENGTVINPKLSFLDVKDGVAMVE
ncbi:hypothetical protein RYX45_20895, partial [Alkalihalophilus pseudofirmus]